MYTKFRAVLNGGGGCIYSLFGGISLNGQYRRETDLRLLGDTPPLAIIAWRIASSHTAPECDRSHVRVTKNSTQHFQ